MEALRIGASEVLEMEPEDLQVLVIGRPGTDIVDAMLYDPMPGGSGLLDQLVERWTDVVRAALDLAADCPSQCTAACVDCFLTFRNSFYHAYLNRNVASNRLQLWSESLAFSNHVPACLPSDQPQAQTVNDAEERLKILLDRAGLSGYQPQHQISFGASQGSTTPDFYFPPTSDHYEGICIYLDGMSRDIHGNPESQRRDRQIREELRNRGYEVIEITHAQLFDREAMAHHFYRIGRFLVGRDTARRLREDIVWFSDR
jgi:hypothetical protein